ncbi:MAG: ABC transporter ATP-binding protein [Thermodesulfobacteriota bacterium]
MILLKGVTKDYKLGATVVHALRGIELEIEEGDFVSICGPSGSGKTTLLNLIGCLDAPDSGTIHIIGEDVLRLTDFQLSRLRNRHIGFIFQMFNLIPVLTAYENVEYPLLILGISRRERQEKVLNILAEVGLDRFIKHKPDELSGGQRQRVAIARALITNPKLVLADEPTANLDSEIGIEILELMKKMNEGHKTTFIFSTHDPEVIMYAEKVYNIRDGRITD